MAAHLGGACRELGGEDYERALHDKIALHNNAQTARAAEARGKGRLLPLLAERGGE